MMSLALVSECCHFCCNPSEQKAAGKALSSWHTGLHFIGGMRMAQGTILHK